MDNETSMDKLTIEIESTSKDSSTEVDTLIEKLSKLKTELQNVVTASGNFSKLKKNIGNVNTGTRVSNIKRKTTGVDYGSEESQLKNLNVDLDTSTLVQSLVTVNSELDRYKTKTGETISISRQFSSSLKGLKNTLQPIKTSTGGIVNANTDLINSNNNLVLSMGNIATKSGEVTKALDRVKVSVSNTSNNNKKNTSLWKMITSGVSGTYAKLALFGIGITRLSTKLADITKQAGDYQESLNLFTVTLGDYAKEAMQWVNKFSDALYLDPANVMQYMGSFNSLVKGLGVGADKSYLMSKNLTQLTYDLASFKNLDFDTAFLKLQSAMSGEIEPLRNVGVALSQATLQELAYSLGIEENVAQMTEAQKAQLRYIQIMKSSSEWQTDMGRTLITPMNALRVLQQQFLLLGRAIGNVFIPILMQMVPYIMVVTKWLTALANTIAGFFGFQLAEIDYSGISAGLGDISGGIADIGDEAGKTAKKLNTMLAPFDELNVVQNQTESGKGGIGGAGAGAGDLGVDLPEYDALANLSDKLKENMAEAEENLKRILPIIKTIGLAFATWKIGKSIANFMSWWDGLSGAGKTTARIALGVSLVIMGLGLKFSGDKAILDEKELYKGIAKQIGGSIGIGLGAGIITKSVPLGIFFGSISLMDSGAKTASHGNTKQWLLGSLEQLIGTAGVAGVAFKMSGGNPIVTLGVTALVTWSNVFFELGRLMELKPTFDEILNAIPEIPFIKVFANMSDAVEGFFTNIGNGIGDFVYDNYDKLSQWAQDTKTNIEYEWGNIQTAIGETNENIKNDISSKWETITTTVGEKVNSIKENVSNKWEEIKTNIGEKVNTIKDNVSTKWEEIKTSVGDKVNTIKDNLGTKWSEISTNVSTKVSEIKDSVTTKFEDTKKTIKTKWDEISSNFSTTMNDIKENVSGSFESIKTTISDKWSSAKTWLSNNIGNKQFWKDKFGGILSGANDILNSLRDKFANWKATLKTPHLEWQEGGHKASGVVKKVLEALNLPTSLPKLKVNWYEQGGFPKTGEFFVARENGIPEMIGQIGNRTAVANNDQITTSITNALMSALNGVDFGGGKSPTTIYIGNKKVYEGYGDYIERENDRYGTNTIRI